MNPFSLRVVISFLGTALVLMVVLAEAARRCRFEARGWRWCLWLALASICLAMFPVDGLPLARWLAGVVDHWSLPLLAIMASAVGRRCFGIELLHRTDRQHAWVFGVAAGAVLYPSALGWGAVDVFGFGWRFGPLFALIGALSAILIWRRSRFGLVLLLAITAWHLGVPESGNYWDCLLDPIYVVVSLGALALSLGRRSRGTAQRNLDSFTLPQAR